jgi:hypothetical protein
MMPVIQAIFTELTPPDRRGMASVSWRRRGRSASAVAR